MRAGSEEVCKHFVDADEDKFVVVTKVKRFRESCGSPKVRDPEVGHALALGNDRCVEYRPFVRRTVDAWCVEAAWQLCGIRIPSGWHDQGYAVRPSHASAPAKAVNSPFDPARSTVDPLVLQHPLRGMSWCRHCGGTAQQQGE